MFSDKHLQLYIFPTTYWDKIEKNDMTVWVYTRAVPLLNDIKRGRGGVVTCFELGNIHLKSRNKGEDMLYCECYSQL